MRGENPLNLQTFASYCEAPFVIHVLRLARSSEDKEMLWGGSLCDFTVQGALDGSKIATTRDFPGSPGDTNGKDRQSERLV